MNDNAPPADTIRFRFHFTATEESTDIITKDVMVEDDSARPLSDLMDEAQEKLFEMVDNVYEIHDVDWCLGD